jgi:sigma-B regulation protein RsbU (phosphoserine phosphatase)
MNMNPEYAKNAINTDGMDKVLKREIHLARNIQSKLLNGDRPNIVNGEVSGISVPARLIGGDYFDFYSLPNERTRIIIGDVMGKGIPAAMLMILTRGAFRSAAESTPGPADTLTAMNNAICQDLRKLNSFVTVFCADWNASTNTFTYSNAGHCLPIIVRRNYGVVPLPSLGTVMLGGIQNQVYVEEQVLLQEGDLVFLYTDGIIEAQDDKGEMFKTERLVELLVQCSNESASTIESIVVDAVVKFTNGMAQRDDITMVTLKVGK